MVSLRDLKWSSEVGLFLFVNVRRLFLIYIDFTDCEADEKKVYNDFSVAFHDLDHGFKKLDLNMIVKGFQGKIGFMASEYLSSRNVCRCR